MAHAQLGKLKLNIKFTEFELKNRCKSAEEARQNICYSYVSFLSGIKCI